MNLRDASPMRSIAKRRDATVTPVAGYFSLNALAA